MTVELTVVRDEETLVLKVEPEIEGALVVVPEAPPAIAIVPSGRGPKGDPGAPGAPGPPGPPGVGFGTADVATAYIQLSAADVWTVVHSLTFMPNVAVVDSYGQTVMGDVTYLSQTTLQITFSAPIAGTAYLS